MILLERFSKEKNAKEFLKTREMIANIFYGLSMIGYIIFWMMNHSESTPTLSVYLTCVLCPVFTFGLFIRSYYYLFIYNWFYALYLLVTLVTFFAVAVSLNVPEYSYYFIYELGHLILACAGGVVVAIVVSVPFKIIHVQVLNANKFYYDSNVLDNLDKYLYPEKYEEEVKKEKEKFLFEGLNETQLQAELSLALKEERFEDAEKIKKVLETKFR